ncbi:dihydroorotase [Winogradskyella maritima]|uniref:Dihydroorotase n=1 Tax=Winogradskyella maritima TaxID=1517766 RepID=A0ABV8AH19_9FLAO|nr:dihydroorotase [Winogradskyella maritima]
MKKYIFSSVFAFIISAFSYSQSSSSTYNVDDVFEIGNVKDNNYKYINFPKANFIIKKGGIVNYDNLKGSKVVITSIEKKENGKQVATIKLTDSRRFFNSHKYVTVDIDKAIENKELYFLNKNL